MKQSSVAICILARDVESGLTRNLPTIRKLRTFFKSSRVVVIENDSKDRTKQILADWAKGDTTVSVFSTDSGIQTILPTSPAGMSGMAKYFSLHRMERMTGFRNQYLEALAADDKPDFVVVIDIDVASFSAAGICHSFGTQTEWDALFSNGKKGDIYYDTYALRMHGDEGAQTLEKIQTNQQRLKNLADGMPLVPVFSAFGGIGIYRYAAIDGLRYFAVPNIKPDHDVEALCDHESLHQEMRKRGHDKLFINPSQEVIY